MKTFQHNGETWIEAPRDNISPVPPDTRVDVLLGNKEVFLGKPAKTWRWGEHGFPPTVIIGYRVTGQPVVPEPEDRHAQFQEWLKTKHNLQDFRRAGNGYRATAVQWAWAGWNGAKEERSEGGTSMGIQKIERWQTSDGINHASLAEAEKYESSLFLYALIEREVPYHDHKEATKIFLDENGEQVLDFLQMIYGAGRIGKLQSALQELFTFCKQVADTDFSSDWCLEDTAVGKQALEALNMEEQP